MGRGGQQGGPARAGGRGGGAEEGLGGGGTDGEGSTGALCTGFTLVIMIRRGGWLLHSTFSGLALRC